MRKSIQELQLMKANKEYIVALTAYDYQTAIIIDNYCDFVLVGDSLGNVFQGEETTLGVTVDQMKYHGSIVSKAIKNAHSYPEMCHFVKYDDIVANPEQEFRKIYEFLDEPYFNHRFDNLDQVSVNGLSYDDRIVGNNMHKLFDGPVRKVYNPYIEKISRKD